MPRAVKLSVTKVASPKLLSSCDQRSTLPPIPPEPCTRMTAGNRSVPKRGTRNAPAMVTGVPFLSPIRNWWSDSVSVGIACSSVRATCALLMGAHRPMKPRQVMPKIAGRKRMLMMDPSRVFSLFDHLVGTCEQRRRHFETERLGSLEIDHLAYPRSKGARSVIALTMALAWKPSSSGTSPALRWIQNVFSPADAAPLMSQEFAEMNPSSGFVTFIRSGARL